MLKTERMMQYTVAVKNEPGQLHRVAAALAKERINILGLTSESIGMTGFVRFIADKGPLVKKALEQAGFSALEAPVHCVALPNRPGELARLARTLEHNGINIETMFGTARGSEECLLVLAVDRVEKVAQILENYSEGLVTADE